MLLCFWRHPLLFISWVQRLKCAVIRFLMLGLHGRSETNFQYGTGTAVGDKCVYGCVITRVRGEELSCHLL